MFRVPHSALRVRSAFSLVEIIVVVGLLSVIVLGLLAMFTQTQRAFRSSMTQVDVLEAGRAASGLLARELGQITPSDASQAVNFYAAIAPPPYQPMLQPLPGVQPPPVPGYPPVNPRTNIIEDLFLLEHQNQTWTGVGYHVDTPNLGVGTLYRFEIDSVFGQNPIQLYAAYSNALFLAYNLNVPLTNMSRIMDGIVHFKVRAFDTNGFWLTTNINANLIATNYPWWGEVGLYTFRSNAVPAAVELEIGILEQRIWEKFKALPTPVLQQQYLTNQAGHVHLFRQRVSIHNVDPTAYQ